MGRQRVTPANEADRLMARVLAEGDRQALEAIRPHVPGPILDGLVRVMEGKSDPEVIRQLAGTFQGAGLWAAAAAAHLCRAEALPMGPERIPAHLDIMEIERRLALPQAVAGRQRLIRRLAGEGNGDEAPPELTDGDFTVQCAFARPDRHLALLESVGGTSLAEDPLRDPFWTKPQWLAGGTALAEDYSFFVVDDLGRAVMLVECDTRGDRYLGCREVGIELIPLRADEPRMASAAALAVRQLEDLTAWSGCPHAWLEAALDRPLFPVMADLINAAEPSGRIGFRTGWIDLAQDEAAILRGYRATTRHILRKSGDSLRIAPHDAHGVDFIASYEDLHRSCGRSLALTREGLAAALDEGRVSGFLGIKDGRPVAAVLTSHHGKTTYDMANVRAGEVTDPVTHPLIHHAVMHARARGQSRFHFGPLYEGGELGEKMRSIALFKRGFSGTFQPRVMIRSV